MAWHLLRCEDLSKSFDGVCALRNVSLHLRGPGIVGIIGPNGAGKTTLLDVVTGLVKPDSGAVWIGDTRVRGLLPHQIGSLGVARTFQAVRVVGRLSVLENALLARRDQPGESLLRAVCRVGVAHHEQRNREVAKGILGGLGLSEKARDSATSLSYGEQKLLSLGACVATEASVLLLDEPIAGVHPEMAEHILGLLVRLKAQGKLVVFIEHDLAAVRKIADTVIVMDEGKVIAEGSPQEVLARPEIMEAFVA